MVICGCLFSYPDDILIFRNNRYYKKWD